MKRALPLLALALALAACGAATEPGEGDPPAAPEAAAAEAPISEPTLDLEATGIVVPPQGGFEQLAVPFGSNRAAAEATLANIVGDVLERADNAECPAEPLATTRFEGLVLTFQDDALVGWTATAPYVPQLSRAQMLEDPAVALVEGSTLGEEFTIGDRTGPVISGLFAGADGAAAIETLWAGTVCAFR